MKKSIIILALAMALPAFARDYKTTEDIINIILSEKETLLVKPPVQEEQKKKPDKKKTADEAGKPSAEDPAQVLLKNGIRLYNSALYDQSMSDFDNVIKNYSDSPLRDQARIWMGKIQIRQYKYDDALKNLSMVPAESGEYPAALFHSAEANSFKGETLAAAELYQRVAAQFPEHDQADNALYRAGSIYLEKNRGNQALESTVRLIRYYRDREMIDDAYYLLGKIFEKDTTLKDMETARKVYRLFLKKAASGEPFFGNSPLINRVKTDLAFIEKRFFLMEQ